MNQRKFSLLVFLFIYSIYCDAQNRIIEQSLNISYGRNYSMFVKNGFENDISDNLAFNGEYSLLINYIKINTGFQYYENKYSIYYNYYHTNRKLILLNHSKHIAFPLLFGVEFKKNKTRVDIQTGLNFQIQLNSESERTLIQDNQIVFEDFSNQINSNLINPTIRLRIDYEVFKFMRFFITTDFIKGISKYSNTFANTNRMNLINSQIGLSFIVNKNEE